MGTRDWERGTGKEARTGNEGLGRDQGLGMRVTMGKLIMQGLGYSTHREWYKWSKSGIVPSQCFSDVHWLDATEWDLGGISPNPRTLHVRSNTAFVSSDEHW